MPEGPGGRESGDGLSLVEAARLGEPWAVSALFDDLHPRLMRFFAAQESRVADDLAAEVWEAVVRGIGGFVGDERALRVWVFAIARRRLANYRRAAVRKPSVPIETGAFDAFAGREMPDRDAIDHLSGVEAAVWIRHLLPPEHAEVVLLRVVADLDTAAVAAVMERSETWVRVTQHRALRRLADRLGVKIGVAR